MPLVLAAIFSASVACQPTYVFLEVENRSGLQIDFIYSEDFVDLREFGRDYASLEIGDIDTYQGCTECDVEPGERVTYETPLSRGQAVTIVARESESERLVYIQNYTYEELREAEWKVTLVNQSG